MPSLSDINKYEVLADDIVEEVVRPERTVWVRSELGADPGALIALICDRLADRAMVIDLPAVPGADGAAHILLQLAAHARWDIAPNEQPNRSIRETANLIARQLNRDGEPVLVMRLPAAWLIENESADGHTFQERFKEVMLGVRNEATLRAVIVASNTREGPRSLGFGFAQKRQLPAPGLSQAFYDEPESWNSYEHAARAVREAITGSGLDFTPIQVRLLVGLAALGTNIDALVSTHGGCPPAKVLWSELGKCMRLEEHKALLTALRRLMRVRLPVPPEDAIDIADPPPDHRPLFTECVGQQERGSGHIRLEEGLFRAVRIDDYTPETYVTTHARLVEHYRQRDGDPSPSGLVWHRTVNWLERAHHLGHAGPDFEDQWHDLDLPTREFYWDRGRSLSREYQRFDAAARVYQACIQKYPDDDYAHHYFDWNRLKNRERPRNIGHHYQKAVELSRRNAWWNSRLITFLVDEARFTDADAAWRSALDSLEEDEYFLARHFHRWVVDAWLGMGEVQRARLAFDQISPSVVGNEVIDALERRLLDAEEAVQLGESVFPPEVPPQDRWLEPPFAVPRRLKSPGNDLVRWFPGRVVSGSANGVEIVLADPSSRRVVRRTLTPDEWSEHGGECPPEDATGYFVFARYADGTGRLFPTVSDGHSPWRPNKDTARNE
jgi:tetratricopeptide (TPR) repeat protein